MDKICQSCGKTLIKVKNESNARFQNKRFCSTICARTYMKINKIGWFNKEGRDKLFLKEVPSEMDYS